jgi:sec-independent protein translocase protein TatC
MSPGTNQSEMPFLDHLEELRWRIIWSLTALAVGVGIGFWVMMRFPIIELLLKPVQPYLGGKPLIITNPADSFRILMTSALILGTIIALPVILWHVWGFLSPALYAHEKRVVIPVLVLASVLFLAGIALSWLVILPLTLKFFTSIQPTGFEPLYAAKEYFGFATSMSLALGAVFELPIAVLALTWLGLVTPAMLNRFRRFAIVGSIVVAAFITPGQDPFSLFALTLPLYLLYEVSVGLSAIVDRRRKRREAESASGEEAGAPA